MNSAPKSPSSPRKQMALPSPRQTIGLAELEAPLDYSFYNMTTLQDVVYWDSRVGYIPPERKYLDTEVADNPARPGAKNNTIIPKVTKPDAEKKLSRSKCFKLNNNCLSEVSELRTVAEGLFEDVDNIAWIDLSFNELTKIDDILLQFPNLQILYLHGNQFSDITEIEKLAKITTLKKLSLHGNPMENEKGYKYMVMSLIPQLLTLDFSRITKADRRTASTMEGLYKNVKRGKRKPKKTDD